MPRVRVRSAFSNYPKNQFCEGFCRSHESDQYTVEIVSYVIMFLFMENNTLFKDTFSGSDIYIYIYIYIKTLAYISVITLLQTTKLAIIANMPRIK